MIKDKIYWRSTSPTHTRTTPWFWFLQTRARGLAGTREILYYTPSPSCIRLRRSLVLTRREVGLSLLSLRGHVGVTLWGYPRVRERITGLTKPIIYTRGTKRTDFFLALAKGLDLSEYKGVPDLGGGALLSQQARKFYMEISSSLFHSCGWKCFTGQLFPPSPMSKISHGIIPPPPPTSEIECSNNLLHFSCPCSPWSALQSIVATRFIFPTTCSHFWGESQQPLNSGQVPRTNV